MLTVLSCLNHVHVLIIILCFCVPQSCYSGPKKLLNWMIIFKYPVWCKITNKCRSHVNAHCIETRLYVAWWRKCDSIPGRGILFISSQKHRLAQGSWSLLFNGYWELFPWRKTAQNYVIHSPVSSAKLKSAWGYTSLSHVYLYKIPSYINKKIHTFIFPHYAMIQQYLLNCSWESSLNDLLHKIMQNMKAGTEGLNTI